MSVASAGVGELLKKVVNVRASPEVLPLTLLYHHHHHQSLFTHEIVSLLHGLPRNRA